VKILSILVYVHMQRNEVVVYERSNFRIGVGLGFQPSTGSSSRCRAEIDKQRLLLFLCRGEGLIGILYPIDGHHDSSYAIFLDSS
jgi:hypothetical protein